MSPCPSPPPHPPLPPAADLKPAPGAHWFSGALDRAAQEDLLGAVRQILVQAPLFAPTMPRTGKPLSVRMSNCGPLGWVSDREGYRYQSFHPETRQPWPAMPPQLLDIWSRFSGLREPQTVLPEACLINYYGADARMSLHQDRDEADLTAPVLSISLGDTALFRLGGLERGAPSQSFRLQSGDIFVLGGESRLAFHGVDRIIPGSSTLLHEGGRFNLTLRRVSVA